MLSMLSSFFILALEWHSKLECNIIQGSKGLAMDKRSSLTDSFIPHYKEFKYYIKLECNITQGWKGLLRTNALT
jgi:hypothetical protein